MKRVVLIVALVASVGVAAATALAIRPDTRTGDGSDGSSARKLGSVGGITLAGFGTSEKTDLDSFRGKPLVINYWASWCPFCISEMPDFQEVYDDVSDRVEILGVDIKDDVEAAKQLAKVTGVRYPLAADPSGEVYTRLRGVAMPTTWFVDEEGRIVERFSGPLTADQLRQRIKEHFGS